MTRASAPPLLLQLQSAGSSSAQAAALRSLKNETIGHDQRKESWIRWGIIPVLANILAARQSPGKGPVSAEHSGGSRLRYPTSEEDEACLQAVIILGSLAQGGAAFLSPIFSSGILSDLLSILSAPGCPSFFVLPILRTLNNVADRLPLQSQQLSAKDTRLADLLFSNDHIGCLARILGQDYGNHHDQAAIELAASLIGKLCTEETHKAVLAECGVLDALAVKVASFIVAQGFVFPGAEAHVQEPGALGSLPPPAPAGAKLAPILRAITVIIEHSKWRAEHFLSSPGILTVFPKQLPEFAPTDIKKGPWGSTYLSGSAVPRHAGASPLEHLLPSIPLAQNKSPANTPNFPPLGHQGTTHHRRYSQSFSTPMSVYDTPTSEDEENPIVPWLLYIVRAESGMVRLMAARLVTVLFRLGLTKKRRVSMLCYLLIPILIRMLDKDYEVTADDGVQYGGLIPSSERLREEAPFVLATLVIDDFELQRHAADGNAIKRLSQLLKETYNPVQEVVRPMWHEEGEDSALSPPESLPAECRLGPPGFSPVHCHVMRYRENILKALAALVPFKDEYRKAVCENGVVPYIIDSLKPCSDDQLADTTTPKNTATHGNPTPTLLAACGAARMLTRSVSVLRTSMIDAGVATPLFVLIKHPDIEVQIAATQVICNLALDFSPMKEAIISADVLPTLCEHAYSPSTKLRIESLWALKHVAYNSTNDVKVRIIDGLGPGYIRQIITQDPINALAKRGLDEEMDNGGGVGMGRANSAGEQVDLLNPIESAGRDEDMKMTDTMPPSKMSLEMFLPDATRRRKLALHGNLDQTTQARQDDIAVQEQTFDLLRNIICGPGASEMIEHLFKTLGQDLILDALADKLRPRSIQLPHRREASGHRALSVPTEILVSVTFVMIHLAAGLPWHRQLLVSHRHLLHYLMGYFNHSHRDVRTNCVWVVINLTYKDDASEEEGCRERAFRLRAMGVMDRLASLGDDPDLDVRERTRTAQDLVNSLTHA
ncbi:armadillo repeat protein [Aspergillus sclerotiicarbonarius CBS 121057]|uniref:Armadillo repeat protein n=1 Tax=Aspergillus sclerotiicarbonarius (strain CBS 121057 / IBT 28362) TaxID=1448318 RepID=A0A319ECM8_ASPSB|nr:armadillo repeat protein [Aspergillus sclerotiicarbonarius CBS 121057]